MITEEFIIMESQNDLASLPDKREVRYVTLVMKSETKLIACATNVRDGHGTIVYCARDAYRRAEDLDDEPLFVEGGGYVSKKGSGVLLSGKSVDYGLAGTDVIVILKRVGIDAEANESDDLVAAPERCSVV